MKYQAPRPEYVIFTVKSGFLDDTLPWPYRNGVLKTSGFEAGCLEEQKIEDP
jgi:hypothetical protein